MPPAKLGLVYSHTGLRRFIDVIGVAHTAELFFVGRNVDADARRAVGLVNEVVDAGRAGRARARAGGRDRRQRAAVAGGQQARDPHAARPQPLPEDVERELVELREACFRSEDFREGVRAFAEKRAPRWQGE